MPSSCLVKRCYGIIYGTSFCATCHCEIDSDSDSESFRVDYFFLFFTFIIIIFFWGGGGYSNELLILSTLVCVCVCDCTIYNAFGDVMSWWRFRCLFHSWWHFLQCLWETGSRGGGTGGGGWVSTTGWQYMAVTIESFDSVKSQKFLSLC